MISQRIEFDNLKNTRDLGGMIGADRRKIKPGKLIRSGHLYDISKNDMKKLSELIDTSVDFRTEQERSEKPEPPIFGVSYYHIPIFEEQKAGVTRDEDSFSKVLQNMLFDDSIARIYMRQSYAGFVETEYSIRQYESFVRLLLEDHEKAILWHCTAGKDRAGFASVIVQELLGVNRENIMEDYLQTNLFQKDEVQYLMDHFYSSTSGTNPETVFKATNYIFTANAEYLDFVYDRIEEHYGSFDGYIFKALHISPEEREQIREKYLE